MIFVQIQTPDKREEAMYGNYYNYEFMIVEDIDNLEYFPMLPDPTKRYRGSRVGFSIHGESTKKLREIDD